MQKQNNDRPTAAPPPPGAAQISSLSSQLAAATPLCNTEPATSKFTAAVSSTSSGGGGGGNAKVTAVKDNAASTSVATADTYLGATGAPFTPRRMSFPNRLALQMPSRGPLSPILDPALGYSVARRPRLDFARSCTSLHHSTLAAESSPDSSPLATSNGYPIPRGNYRPLDSPISNNHHHHHTGSSHASSLGSASMLDYVSGDDSDSSTDEDLDVEFDLMDTAAPSNNAPAPTAMESAASLSLLNHQKARFGARYPSRRSSTSSRNKPMMTPSPIMHPAQHSPKLSGGFDYPMRRNSVTLGPSALEYEGDRPDPVRRPVSRRGSLLPKTKNFQRIKAALIEESSPIDLEVKREAEITRQIREEESLSPNQPHSQSQPQGTMESELANIGEEDLSAESGDSASQRGMGISFSKQAERHGGFWFGEQMDGICGSPPAFPGLRIGSDGDIIMNSDSVVNSPVAPTAISRPPKRRRTQDERFELNVFKRRAVSPGLSNSPKLTQSPPGNGGGKRLNFQGFSDTHDGLMKMSLQ